ncbi:hypothetical protein KC19_8G090800 [Ceratodon purpureus]|uniref:Uncharacterized protein n=1 Tax=Ceratodon purpureus TaxID=3225 RepID=A0A8T0GWP7_CERPU|nr:hypothetical protein KC19_8G090800 [Ceratodon purpureus]
METVIFSFRLSCLSFLIGFLVTSLSTHCDCATPTPSNPTCAWSRLLDQLNGFISKCTRLAC